MLTFRSKVERWEHLVNRNIQATKKQLRQRRADSATATPSRQITTIPTATLTSACLSSAKVEVMDARPGAKRSEEVREASQPCCCTNLLDCKTACQPAGHVRPRFSENYAMQSHGTRDLPSICSERLWSAGVAAGWQSRQGMVHTAMLSVTNLAVRGSDHVGTMCEQRSLGIRMPSSGIKPTAHTHFTPAKASVSYSRRCFLGIVSDVAAAVLCCTS